MSHEVQPAVHRLAACVRAPSATLSSHDGDVRAEGAHGFYLGDRRLLSRFVLRVGGRPARGGRPRADRSGDARRAGVVRDGSEPSPDPRLLLTRTRRQHDAGFVEVIELSSWDLVPRTVPLRIEAACDLARTDEVKDGRTVPRAVDRGTSGSGLRFAGDGYAVEVTSGDAPVVDVGAGSLTWEVSVEPHATHRLTISVSAVRPRDGRFRPLVPPAGAPAWAVDVTTDDPRIDRFVRWGRDDLEHLLLADPEAPTDAFAAAGSPWFFTLFGRDSLWTARMMLPFGTDVAMSTLRVLARRQGVRHDPTTDEQPGRILHEMRTAPVDTIAAQLPPLYYGTIDATQLWMLLLAESWRWGAPVEQVESLLPALERAAGVAARRRRRRWRRPVRIPQRLRPRPLEPGLEGLGRLRGLAARSTRRGSDRAQRGAGLHLRGGARGGRPARAVRTRRSRRAARLRHPPARGVPRRLLGGRRRRAVPGHRARRRQAGDHRAVVEPRPRARYRPARRR